MRIQRINIHGASHRIISVKTSLNTPEAISLELFRGFIPFIVPSGVVDETGDLLEIGKRFFICKKCIKKKAEEAFNNVFRLTSLRWPHSQRATEILLRAAKNGS